MRKTYLDVGAAVLALLVSAAALSAAWQYPGGSGLMPRAVLIICIGLSLLWLGQSVGKARNGPSDTVTFDGRAAWRFAFIVGGTALAILGTATLGFFTSALVLLPLMAVAIGYRDPVRLAVGTVAFVALLYGVFHLLLKIPLPPEALLTHWG